MPTKKTTKKQATVSSTSATNSKATKKKRATKSAAANNPSSVDSAEKTKNRKLTPNYKSFQLQKRIKHPDALPRARHMFISAVKHMWRYKRLFLGVFAVYLIGSVVLVQSLQNAESAQFVRDAIEEAIEGGLGRILGGTAVLSLLASGATSAPTDVAGVYQMIFFLVITLATVWSLRQTFGERRPADSRCVLSGHVPPGSVSISTAGYWSAANTLYGRWVAFYRRDCWWLGSELCRTVYLGLFVFPVSAAIDIYDRIIVVCDVYRNASGYASITVTSFGS
jgi:hypothetical protein